MVKTHTLYPELDQKGQDFFLQSVLVEHCSAKTVLLAEGQQCERMYVLLSGIAAVWTGVEGAAEPQSAVLVDHDESHLFRGVYGTCVCVFACYRFKF
jgi:hypothetical protein